MFTSEKKAPFYPFISHRIFSTNYAGGHEYFLSNFSASEVQLLLGTLGNHDGKTNRGIKLTVDFRFQNSRTSSRVT
jgi:hypothetical protein